MSLTNRLISARDIMVFLASQGRPDISYFINSTQATMFFII